MHDFVSSSHQTLQQLTDTTVIMATASSASNNLESTLAPVARSSSSRTGIKLNQSTKNAPNSSNTSNETENTVLINSPRNSISSESTVCPESKRSSWDNDLENQDPLAGYPPIIALEFLHPQSPRRGFVVIAEQFWMGGIGGILFILLFILMFVFFLTADVRYMHDDLTKLNQAINRVTVCQ